MHTPEMPLSKTIPGALSLDDAARARRVLVVEDDQMSRSLLQFALEKRGYEVAVAENSAYARELLTQENISGFECVVTDYRMPESDGLDLLAWIRSRDPNLATIIITAESEKQLVTKSFRQGAIDFLDKPIDLEKLHVSVARAILRTRRDRHLTESEAAVKNLGQAQAWMLGTDSPRDQVRAEVYFHPRHEAGGDFFSRFHSGPEQFFFLLTDVSGHEPQTAYVSAYFHGIVRGMMRRGAALEDVFAEFNRFLVEEWNRPDALLSRSGIISSIGACAIGIDVPAQKATVITHGMPAPVYWRPTGEAWIVGETGGPPLGWFDEFTSANAVQSIADGGAFCLWTDGLEEEAAKRGVSELSLAWALQQGKGGRQNVVKIDSAGDDVLLADIRVRPGRLPANSFRPFILEKYEASRAAEIDAWQALWGRSLQLVAPGMPDSTFHDVLLASREAVLNAVQHGCQTGNEKIVFQAAYSPGLQTVRVRVCDPGPGHNFDVKQHETLAAEELVEKHRGLILIQYLATRLHCERNGAGLTMDFIMQKQG